MEVLLVKCLYRRSLRAGAWERDAVFIRALMVDGSNPATKLDGLVKS